MIYALISDIHSNVEALEAVLKDAQEQGVQGYLCVGDIVGYGAEPHECVQKVRQLQGVVIAGNHDYAACGKADTTYFNSYARKAVQWTTEQLPAEDLDYLKKLPLMFSKEDFCLVHGSLNQPATWEYIFTEEEALNTFLLLKQRILFIGHSHVPVVFSCQNRQVTTHKAKDFKMEPNIQYIVNIGSVGQPRDMDPRACYCVYNSEREEVFYRRVAYDFRSTQKKILKAGLPEILAMRLELGR